MGKQALYECAYVVTDDLSRLGVSELANTIRMLRRRRVEEAWEMGRLLGEVKGRLQHGEWMPFLDSVGVSHDVAARMIRMHGRFEIHEIHEFRTVSAVDKFIRAENAEKRNAKVRVKKGADQEAEANRQRDRRDAEAKKQAEAKEKEVNDDEVNDDDVTDWKAKFEAEVAARREAEGQVAQLTASNEQLARDLKKACAERFELEKAVEVLQGEKRALEQDIMDVESERDEFHRESAFASEWIDAVALPSMGDGGDVVAEVEYVDVVDEVDVVVSLAGLDSYDGVGMLGDDGKADAVAVHVDASDDATGDDDETTGRYEHGLSEDEMWAMDGDGCRQVVADMEAAGGGGTGYLDLHDVNGGVSDPSLEALYTGQF